MTSKSVLSPLVTKTTRTNGNLLTSSLSLTRQKLLISMLTTLMALALNTSLSVGRIFRLASANLFRY